MKLGSRFSRRWLTVLIAGGALSIGVASAYQLYGSDSTSVKGGDLLDRDYWRAKWDSFRMDEAIKERQPEGAIMMANISNINLLNELVGKYPNHQDLKAWKAHAEDVQKRIDPNASRSESFKPGSIWNEYNYKESYVNYNYAKVGIEKKDWAAAHDGLSYAERNLQFLVERIKKNDRVAAWPDGAAKWVQDTWADLARLNAQVNAKLK
jgi:hypothetical protein